jgi:predicted RNA-binding protein with PIN domain
MSLHYVLDGYNIMNKLFACRGRALKDGRDQLLRYIRANRPQGKNRATIIFDGRSGEEEQFFLWGRSQALDFSGPEDIKVAFSKNGSADEWIKALVRHSRNPKVLIVITDDRQLQFAVRSLGARTKSVEEFLKTAKPKPLRHKTGVGPKEPVCENLARRITSELEKIWLKKDSPGKQDPFQ